MPLQWLSALTAILSQAGVVLDDDDAKEEAESKTKKEEKKIPVEKKKIPAKTGDYSSYTTEELKEELMKAIDDEAYEKASKIRDELNKRKQS
jgi:protein-arginine kinase activator protein McsA